jgi:3-isopropylmalate/(R)-2-methylmalate dehydratase large subunit
MAIDYFNRMGGEHVFDPKKIMFALDHYSGTPTPKTRSFHEAVRDFAAPRVIEMRELGDGISFQIAAETGRALPGSLIIGADSHTVTCGALNLFATGIGSSDLAAAMITGRVWLRVPESIHIKLTGEKAFGTGAKDIALAIIAELGPEGANYRTLEFSGRGVAELTLEDRLVIANLAVEAGAKAAIFPFDHKTADYLSTRTPARIEPVAADPGAVYVEEMTVDIGDITPRVARPHSPNDVVDVSAMRGTRIDMVFLGTCTGGRVPDFHEALAVLERNGSRVSPSVTLVVTPASRQVHDALVADGTIPKLAAMGAIITENGCGACCGTAGVIPSDGMNVLSTANRNFKARMGNATASIYLASPLACAAAAVTGFIVDPRTL